MMQNNCSIEHQGLILDNQTIRQTLIASIQAGFINDHDQLLQSKDQLDAFNSINRTMFVRQTLPVLLSSAFMMTDQTHKCSPVDSLLGSGNLRRILVTQIQPIVIFITLITNSLILFILTRRHMRNPTNTLLFGIALFNLLTVILPLPVYLALSLLNVLNDHLTVVKGYATYYLTTVLPTIFHTIAIWLNTILALQRYVYLYKPLVASRCFLCRQNPLLLTIGLIILIAIGLHLPISLLTNYQYGVDFCVTEKSNRTTWTVESSSSSVWKNTSIALGQPVLIKCHSMTESVFFTLALLRASLVDLLPSIALCILTGLLVVALHRFNVNRNKLRSTTREQNKTFSDKRQTTRSKVLPVHITDNHLDRDHVGIDDQAELVPKYNKSVSPVNKRDTGNSTARPNDSTSVMMLVILGLFLLVEVPTTCVICLNVFSMILNYPISYIFEVSCHFML